MNEAAQVLKQTNHERKVAGYGAHHKKGGSAVSKLGNKPMSWQEIQSKHGECKEFDLGGFMDYETFKKMDPDLEAEYVNKLCEKHHVRHEQVSKYLFELGENDLMARLKIKGVDISKVLFGKSESTLDQYFYTKDLKSSLHMTKPCAPDARKEKTKVFTDAVNSWRGESVVKEKTETAAKPVKEEPSEVARDILAAIIGEEPKKPSDVVDKVEKSAEVTVEESKKDDLPESNISAVYVPVPREKFDDSVEEMSEEPLETVADVESFVEQPDIPKAAPKPSSEVHFSTRYISEKGLDRETILNKIYLLASLFENEENLEITLTVATKKEA